MIIKQTNLKIGKRGDNAKNSELFGWKVVKIDSLEIDQHLERSESKHCGQIYHTECHEKNGCYVFPLFLDEEDKSKGVSEDTHHGKNEVHHKQDVLRMVLHQHFIVQLLGRWGH